VENLVKTHFYFSDENILNPTKGGGGVIMIDGGCGRVRSLEGLIRFNYIK